MPLVVDRIANLEPVATGRVPQKALEVRNLSVRFGGVVALDSVSLRVEPGQILGLIGPNGAGKTTLIDAITGFVHVSSGTIELDGAVIGKESVARRSQLGIGRSFQNLELFEDLTVQENLQVACDPSGLSNYLTDLVLPRRSELSDRALEMVQLFELEGELSRKVRELPYGRRRLCAIARAAAGDPSVLLLDEPAAGLGSVEVAELSRLVTRLAHDHGVAVLLIEHNIDMVVEVCDHIVVLDFGKEIARGVPADVRRNNRVLRCVHGRGSEHRRGPNWCAPRCPRPLEGSDDADENPECNAVRLATSKRLSPTRRLLRADGITSGYDGIPAIRNLSLSVKAGEVVALLGANGAGKTTTLLTLAGEVPLHSGHVTWLGQPARGPLHRRARSGLCMLTEERSLFMGLTVRQNLRLGRGPSDKALEIMPELVELMNRRAGLLSGGEQQMLTLARALAGDFQLLMIDEISLGLAPIIVRRLLSLVRQAAEERNLGVLLVEQHIGSALNFSDRAIVLRRGDIVLEGDSADLRGRVDEITDAYL